MRGVRHLWNRFQRQNQGTKRGRPRRHSRIDLVEPLESRVVLSVGGGSTAAGFVGQYFNNLNLSGTPQFTRNDVRIDFNWGGTSSPGGSTDPLFSAIGANNFSVSWTGQVVASFSETYTIATTTAGGVRLSMKPAGTSTWTQIINDWTDHEPATTDSGQVGLIAGGTYDLEMDYFAASGQPEAALDWSSPSTPPEVIDPLGVSGLNFIPHSLPPATFADAMKQGRDQWLGSNTGPVLPMDQNGWPLEDAMNVVWEGQTGKVMMGTYQLQYEGKANVKAWPVGTWQVGSTSYGSTLPAVGI